MKMDLLSEEEKLQWAWFAGIMDGEGTIGIYLYKDKEGHRQDVLQVGIEMAHEPTIKQIDDIARVGSIQVRHRPPWKPMFGWHASNREAASVLRYCMPFLVTKKAQAELGIEFMELKRLTRRGGQGATLALSDISRRERIQQAIQQLNKRGG